MISQSAIALTGVLAIWLTQQNNENLKRYACIFGLAGQPFWFYSAYSSGQWGVILLCVFYSYAWAVGFIRFWVINSEDGR